MPTIFLSHNWKDKPVVEPVAIELSKVYGQNSVFYDDWSILPGEGIITRMNEGLAAPDFFFFFVTANSLKSKMVELEWQSALFQATSEKVTFVPVRVDGTPLPPIILQNRYIDMHTNGIASTIDQIKKRIAGNQDFEAKHQGFSNLTFEVTGDPAVELKIKIKASHMQESNPKFMFLIKNSVDDVFVWIEGAPGIHSGPNQVHEIDGLGKASGMVAAPLSGSIRPNFPITFTIKPKAGSNPVELLAVMHETKLNWFDAIPGGPGV
ncbi:toll/interleukin-1 receptor domain-containing protein [Pseudomonas japonica]|uniref:toll/interleukin-1 receptor domain-containing protein n=1 Tax=Pseudomonas japonica TaxID=256466 RepID=UPI0015E4406F|nr:toll/interleukin-1 receptor domain-containing protein [Pseudomonas japonica]MBA1291615.1 toll/interleukin-1 receptor domain-containing protein [Pseudomonas japonica]